MAFGPVFYPPSHSQKPGQFSRPEGKVLIVGDEAQVRRALHTSLYSLGFDIGEALSTEEAVALCRIVHYDAILLDVGVPGRIGIETYAELRRLLPRVAILLLSVNDNRDCKAEALEAGADDYLTRPFEMRELTARIRAALRRAPVAAAQSGHVIAIGEISLHPARRLMQKAGRRIHLTPREFELLQFLITHPGIPVTHGRLLHFLWGDEFASRIDCLRTLVRQLRKKIEDDPGAPRYLLTESCIGYRFVAPEDWLRSDESARRFTPGTA
jgi:two-component system KDP operon response regulator KdpE